ncbi:hypothetical protein KQX54_004486 [Cotesia glomerata]|uniref:Uncharacterized protein n=1 Tax=Cotesia glomerata TaxID=32391 RepID=A0AAV7IKY4_COTGL|nr:hypothetical protein KQX54_004486 [Cotesia glomerata]
MGREEKVEPFGIDRQYFEVLNGICNANKEEERRRKGGGYHELYNGVVCNDTILATGVFSSKELWMLSKGTTVSKQIRYFLHN